MMNASTRNRFCFLAAALLVAVGCSSDDPKSPTAPPATPVDPIAQAIYSVTVVPSKGSLEANSTTASIIEVRAVRTDNGAPPPNLTKLNLTTTLGSFGNVGGPNVLEAEFQGGLVSVPFFGGGTIGTATIRAQVTGSGISSGSVGFGTVRVVEPGTPATFFLSSVSPNVGGPLGGENVTIRGGGFDEPLRVLFGGVPAVIRSSSADEIRVTAPALVNSLEQCGTTPSTCNQTVSVSVTINLNEEGQASDTLANAYSYSNGGGGQILQPIIFSITPSSGPNEGGTQVVINGDGFQSPVKVEFGKGTQQIPYVEAQVLSVTQTRIVAVSPAASSFGQGNLNQLVDVRVSNLNSGRTGLASNAFKYGVAVLVTSISPSEGSIYGGTQVIIFGQGFDEPVAVDFGGIAQQVLSVSGSEIVVRTTHPTSCVTGSALSVKVVNIENGSFNPSTGGLFSYLKPNIFSISPTSGPQAGNTLMTISGANFGTPVVVTFNVGSAFQGSVQSATATSISVRTPAVPDSVFTSASCDDDGDGTPGNKYQPKTATVTITDPISGCSDTFEGVFTYLPTDSSCRGD